jgi:DNA-binding response OmpR family regulator
VAETILIVDDDRTLAGSVQKLLEREGWSVRRAGDADEALAELRRSVPDLILLDVKMPGMTGFDLCKKLKAEPAWAAVPVIFLTSRDEPVSKVLGFELGGDDYVTKPFNAPELMARVKARLRGRAGSPGMEALESGGLAVSVEGRTLSVDGGKKALPPKEFDLLCLLLRNKGRVLTKSFIFEQVWGGDLPDRDTHTVETHVYRLRKSLGPYGERVKAVSALGYKWEEP